MERLNPSARADQFGRKINRDHSPVLIYGIPWLSVLLASLTPILPIIAPAPIVPPLAYMMILAWRLLRPGLLPMWAGFPLGLFDDLLSGQPLGSSILLFTTTLVALDLLEMRFPWRGFLQDWLVSCVFIAAFLFISAFISGASISLLQLGLIGPQMLLSALLFPIIVRIASVLDRLRLLRVKRIG